MSYTLTTLKSTIQDYTENTETNFTTHLRDFIRSAENRLFKMVDFEYFRKNATSATTTSDPYFSVPTDFLAPISLSITNSSSKEFLLEKDVNFLQEYHPNASTTGTPKYYAMSGGGATGAGATTSGKVTLVPTPSSGFMYKLHYNAKPLGLSSANTTTYLSTNFGNGLLYACLVEAFSYLKGPMDMLQLYEQKYQTEVQKFGGEQIGRRRRDDYTDGEPRIPATSPAP